MHWACPLIKLVTYFPSCTNDISMFIVRKRIFHSGQGTGFIYDGPVAQLGHCYTPETVRPSKQFNLFCLHTIVEYGIILGGKTFIHAIYRVFHDFRA